MATSCLTKEEVIAKFPSIAAIRIYAGWSKPNEWGLLRNGPHLQFAGVCDGWTLVISLLEILEQVSDLYPAADDKDVFFAYGVDEETGDVKVQLLDFSGGAKLYSPGIQSKPLHDSLH